MFSIISFPFFRVQKFVDNIAMYRLVSGSLTLLSLISVVFGFIGFVPYSGLSQIFSLAVAVLVALVLNSMFSVVLRVPANHESAYITALILFFLALPEEHIFATWPLVLAVAIAIISKFTLVYKKQHFLNPAALGAAAVSVTGLYSFSWWVANPSLFVPLLITGVLVVMKVRKWVPVLALIGVSVVIYTAESVSYGEAVASSLRTFFLSWPTLFLAFYMLTEPFTMPSQKGPQFLYGGVVGFLSSSSIFSAVVSFTPELALVAGNALMVPFRLKQKLFLPLEQKVLIAKDTYEFVFKKPPHFNFQAGQYLEWMLPHKPSDSRGIRRYFTIASSPTEPNIRVAMKIFDRGSSFKQALLAMDTNETIIGSQLAGDFILPDDAAQKIGLIAGGIGITPFRSYLQYMIDSGRHHNTVLYYGNNTKAEIAYEDIFMQARTLFPLEIIHVIAKETVSLPFEEGYIDAAMIMRRTPDFLERVWYISGPPGMVQASEAALISSGVARRNIKTDFFPGVV